MPLVALSLGSNMGDRAHFMDRMLSALSSITNVVSKTPIFETEPVGVDSVHGAYMNQLILATFSGTPEELLSHTEEIERSLGRDKKGELAPRTADIDILLFEGEERSSKRLTIPHSAILERRFILDGLSSIVPNWKFNGVPFSELALCDDHLKQVIRVLD